MKQLTLARQVLIHGSLFFLTLFTTTIAGIQWLGIANPFELANFAYGLPYSLTLLFIVSAHEFGHYFAARAHRVEATLPYYLPFPPFVELMALFLNFGTFGAIIRTKSAVPSRRALFDIGVAGPIAGFIASLIVLIYGFTHLPDRSFILSVHPDYDFAINASAGSSGMWLAFGDPLLMKFLRALLTDPIREFVPPMTEIYHYPFLCVGWFGLFLTSLNLVPLGQFDGGHLSYAMFGERHRVVAKGAFFALVALSIPSLADVIVRTIVSWTRDGDPGMVVPLAEYSWAMWFAWALIAFYIVKLYHPPVADETPLDPVRETIGWMTFAIFIVSFMPVPIAVGM